MSLFHKQNILRQGLIGMGWAKIEGKLFNAIQLQII
jgi:hypothetical protein